MKRIITLILVILQAMVLCSQPQNGRPHFSPEEMKQHLNEFITREAHLTPDEAQKVMPILETMLKEQWKLAKKETEAIHTAWQTKTESDFERAIDKATDLAIESKKVERRYYKKMHSVISWQKVLCVRRAARKFSMEALKKFEPRKRQSK